MLVASLMVILIVNLRCCTVIFTLVGKMANGKCHIILPKYFFNKVLDQTVSLFHAF